MKQTIGLLCCFFFLHIAHAQIAFFDAKKLRDLGVGAQIDLDSGFVVLPENDNVASVIAKYANGTPNAKLRDAFAGNPVMRFPHSGSHGFNDNQIAPVVTKASSFFSSLGGLPVTNIANGIAQFM